MGYLRWKVVLPLYIGGNSIIWDQIRIRSIDTDNYKIVFCIICAMIFHISPLLIALFYEMKIIRENIKSKERIHIIFRIVIIIISTINYLLDNMKFIQNSKVFDAWLTLLVTIENLDFLVESLFLFWLDNQLLKQSKRNLSQNVNENCESISIKLT